jgi:hypothetical protein
MLRKPMGCLTTHISSLFSVITNYCNRKLGKLTSACMADVTDRLNMVLSRLPTSCMRIG